MCKYYHFFCLAIGKTHVFVITVITIPHSHLYNDYPYFTALLEKSQQLGKTHVFVITVTTIPHYHLYNDYPYFTALLEKSQQLDFLASILL